MRAFLLLALVAGVSCIPVCQVEQSRCHGDSVQVCDANGRWQEVMDCADVVGPEGTAWLCGSLPDGDAGVTNACLPEAERPSGGL